MRHPLPYLLLLTAACGQPLLEQASDEAEVRTLRAPSWRPLQGRAVRALTAEEAQALHLLPGTSFLIDDRPLLDAMARHAESAELLVPLSAARGVLLPLERVLTARSPIPFLLRDGRGPNPVSRLSNPTFHEYLSSTEAIAGSEGALVRLVVQDGQAQSTIGRGLVLGSGAVELGVLPVGRLPAGMAPAGASAVFTLTLGTVPPSAPASHSDCEASGFSACNALCADSAVQGACDSDSPHPCCQPYNDGDADPVNQCNNGVDDDGDGTVDSSDSDCRHGPYCDDDSLPYHWHKYEAGADVGLFGEVSFCTRNTNNWGSRLWLRAADVHRIFHTHPGELTGNDFFDDWIRDYPVSLVRVAIVGCWVLDSQEEADDCRDWGGAHCAPFTAGSSHPYPYAAAASSQYAYAGAVKLDVAHAATVGLKTPLNAAQVIVDVPTFENFGVVGYADDIPGFGSTMANVPHAGEVSGHELGHSFSLIHALASIVATSPGGQNTWSLMSTDSEDQDGLPPGDVSSDRLGLSEAGALYSVFRDTHNFHSPSFGNH